MNAIHFKNFEIFDPVIGDVQVGMSLLSRAV